MKLHGSEFVPVRRLRPAENDKELLTTLFEAYDSGGEEALGEALSELLRQRRN